MTIRIMIRRRKVRWIYSCFFACALGLEDYLADLREVVRILRHGLPSTTQLLEEAVKGVVLALDGEFELTRQELRRRKASEEALAKAQQEIEYLRWAWKRKLFVGFSINFHGFSWFFVVFHVFSWFFHGFSWFFMVFR